MHFTLKKHPMTFGDLQDFIQCYNPENQTSFWLDAEELPTLLTLDIVHVVPDINPEFLSNIKKDSVLLYAPES